MLIIIAVGSEERKRSKQSGHSASRDSAAPVMSPLTNAIHQEEYRTMPHKHSRSPDNLTRDDNEFVLSSSVSEMNAESPVPDPAEVLEMDIPADAKLLQLLATKGVFSLPIDLQWPKIVVLGPQSCGKSSIIEMLTGVTWPRGENRTTAFATALTLLYGQEEKLGVSLHKPVDDESIIPARIAQRIAHFSQEWANHPIKELGSIITAAASILLADGSSFSTWELRVVYEAPQNPGAAVTWVDLPGLVGREPDHSIVSGIAKCYIAGTNNLILHTVQADVDLDGSQSFNLIDLVDPAENRVYTVATKSDFPQINSWVFERLEKNLSTDVHGNVDGPLCFATVGLGTRGSASSLKVFHDPRWSSYRQYCGTDSLRHRALLWAMKHCSSAIGQIRRCAVDNLQDVQDALALLPPQPPRRSAASVARAASRHRLDELLDSMEVDLHRLPIAALLEQQTALQPSLAARGVIRVIRAETERVIREIIDRDKACWAVDVQPFFFKDLVSSFDQALFRVRTKLGLQTMPNAIALNAQAHMTENMISVIMSEVIDAEVCRLRNVAQEEIMGDRILAARLLKSPHSHEEEIEVTRADLEAQLLKYREISKVLQDGVMDTL